MCNTYVQNFVEWQNFQQNEMKKSPQPTKTEKRPEMFLHLSNTMAKQTLVNRILFLQFSWSVTLFRKIQCLLTILDFIILISFGQLPRKRNFLKEKMITGHRSCGTEEFSSRNTDVSLRNSDKPCQICALSVNISA